MKRLYILSSFLLCISPNLLAQNKKTLGGHEYLFKSDGWYKIHNELQYKVDAEIITIRFKTNETQSIQSLINKYELSVVRKSINGYYDLQVPRNSSPIEIAEQLFEEFLLIESIDVNTFGEYGLNRQVILSSGYIYWRPYSGKSKRYDTSLKFIEMA